MTRGPSPKARPLPGSPKTGQGWPEMIGPAFFLSRLARSDRPDRLAVQGAEKRYSVRFL